MNREEKNAMSRQRILDAALEEFSAKGYESASLSTVCAEKGISKGIIYHHFKDKDELYLLCVGACFDAFTAYLEETAQALSGSVREQLQAYFDARLRFFARYPVYLGIFAGASFHPPEHLASEIAMRRRGFDERNIAVLTELLNSGPLRPGLSVPAVVEDFRMYMDYFHIHFQLACGEARSARDVLKEYEERCHRQIDILLYGVFGENHETR